MRSPPPEVALKIHRRRYGHDGRREFFVARQIEEDGLPLESISLPLDGFQLPEGNVCLAYPLLGKDLNRWNKDRGHPFSVEETRMIAGKALVFLEAFHRTGAAHTDIKPDNFLYDPETGQFRLIDFGNTERHFKRGTPVATREYTPPEGIIGGELGTPIDLWSLACTLFELLTGELLFDPHDAAGKKYIEFADEEDEEADPEEEEEETDEEDGPCRPGLLVAGKYRLIEELGDGNFARVWRAEVLAPQQRLETLSPLRRPATSKRDRTTATGSADAAPKPDRAREARRNNLKRFGVTDTYDLALNYEHLLLMQNLLGPCPAELALDGIFHRIYFNGDGSLKFDPPTKSPMPEVSIRTRLCHAGVGKRDALRIESLLLSMLRYDPAERASAAQCLRHPWLFD
jgi:serine/threonine protein kinase